MKNGHVGAFLYNIQTQDLLLAVDDTFSDTKKNYIRQDLKNNFAFIR